MLVLVDVVGVLKLVEVLGLKPVLQFAKLGDGLLGIDAHTSLHHDMQWCSALFAPQS